MSTIPAAFPAVRPEKILLFVGSGRTGSTLLGQVLNCHPECLVANEARVLTRWTLGEERFDELVARAAQEAFDQFLTGLERSGKFARSNAVSQPRWRPFAGLAGDPAFAKTLVRVVGDKKAGGASEAIMTHTHDIAGLMDRRPIVLLQVVRDPVAAARSAVRAHGLPSFAAACERMVAQSAAAYRFGRRYSDRYLTLAYEDLCASPRAELSRVAAWLGLAAPARWLEEMTARVGAAGEPCDDPNDRACARAIVAAHDAGALFDRYGGAVPASAAA